MAASVMVDGILQPDEPEVVADCGGLARLELARVQPAIDRPLRHIEPDRQLRHRDERLPLYMCRGEEVGI